MSYNVMIGYDIYDRFIIVSITCKLLYDKLPLFKKSIGKNCLLINLKNLKKERFAKFLLKI
jgi:hypothetical protein